MITVSRTGDNTWRTASSRVRYVCSLSMLKPEIWVVVEIDGKHHQREICGKNFHDIKKDMGEAKKQYLHLPRLA